MWIPYLNNAAAARCRLHRIQGNSVGVLATGEDDTAPPTARRSRLDAVRHTVAVQPVTTSITLWHVDEEQGTIWKTKRRLTNKVWLGCALMPFKREMISWSINRAAVQQLFRHNGQNQSLQFVYLWPDCEQLISGSGSELWPARSTPLHWNQSISRR